MALLDPKNDIRESYRELEERFTIGEERTPSEEELQLHKDLKKAVLALARKLNESTEDGREKSLALTHLEDFLLRAGQAIFK